MTHENHNAAETERLERETKEAIIHLTHCIEQRRWLCVIAFVCAATSLVLATCMATIIYGY